MPPCFSSPLHKAPAGLATLWTRLLCPSQGVLLHTLAHLLGHTGPLKLLWGQKALCLQTPLVYAGFWSLPTWILETGEDKAAEFPPASTWHPPTNYFPFWLQFYAQAQSWEAWSLLFTHFLNSLITFRAQVFETQIFLCCVFAVITFL